MSDNNPTSPGSSQDWSPTKRQARRQRQRDRTNTKANSTSPTQQNATETSQPAQEGVDAEGGERNDAVQNPPETEGVADPPSHDIPEDSEMNDGGLPHPDDDPLTQLATSPPPASPENSAHQASQDIAPESAGRDGSSREADAAGDSPQNTHGALTADPTKPDADAATSADNIVPTTADNASGLVGPSAASGEETLEHEQATDSLAAASAEQASQPTEGDPPWGTHAFVQPASVTHPELLASFEAGHGRFTNWNNTAEHTLEPTMPADTAEQRALQQTTALTRDNHVITGNQHADVLNMQTRLEEGRQRLDLLAQQRANPQPVPFDVHDQLRVENQRLEMQLAAERLQGSMNLHRENRERDERIRDLEDQFDTCVTERKNEYDAHILELQIAQRGMHNDQACEAQIQGLEDKIKADAEVHARARETNNTMMQKIIDTNGELEATLRHQIQVRDNVIEAQESVIDANKVAWEETKDELLGQIQDCEDRINRSSINREREKQQRDNTIRDLENQITTLNASDAAAAENVLRLQQQVQDRDEQMHANKDLCEKEKKERDDRIKALEDQIATLNTRETNSGQTVTDLQQQIQERDNQIQANKDLSDEEIKKRDDAIDNLVGRNTQLLTDLRTQTERTRREKQKASMIIDAHSENIKLHNTNARLETTIAEMIAAAESAGPTRDTAAGGDNRSQADDELIRDLQQQVRDQQATISQCRDDADTSGQHAQVQIQRIAQLEQEAASSGQDQRPQTDALVRALRDSVEEQARVIDVLRADQNIQPDQRIELLNARIRALEATLNSMETEARTAAATGRTRADTIREGGPQPADDRVKWLEAQVAALTQELATCTGQLDGTRAANQQLMDDIGHLQRRIQDHDADVIASARGRFSQVTSARELMQHYGPLINNENDPAFNDHDSSLFNSMQAYAKFVDGVDGAGDGLVYSEATRVDLFKQFLADRVDTLQKIRLGTGPDQLAPFQQFYDAWIDHVRENPLGEHIVLEMNAALASFAFAHDRDGESFTEAFQILSDSTERARGICIDNNVAIDVEDTINEWKDDPDDVRWTLLNQTCGCRQGLVRKCIHHERDCQCEGIAFITLCDVHKETFSHMKDLKVIPSTLRAE